MTGCPGISKPASLAEMPQPLVSSKPEVPTSASRTTPSLKPSPQEELPKPRALVAVVPEFCKGCELCVYACPSGNLTMSPGLNNKGYHRAVFSYNGKRGPCTACGLCYWVCPDMAISEIRRLTR